MANKRRRTSKKKVEDHKQKLIAAVAALVLVVLGALLGPERLEKILDALSQQTGMSVVTSQVEGDLKIHFIDVGQGDSTLIQTKEKNVLIDAGERGSEDTVIAYLEGQGVSRLDLVVATHMHSDHIGGMPPVLEAFEVDEILLSPLPEDLTPTTKIYEKLLDTIEAQGMEVTESEPGMAYSLGNDTILTVLGPVSEKQEDINNTSVVCRVTYGDTAFLFCGDAEKGSEEEMLERWKTSDLKADVLKLGHHGSRTSSSQKWLDAVKPEIAAALCGKGNDYGHPHEEVVKRLDKMGVTLYRSDINGHIVIGSDGDKIAVELQNQAA